jgi:alpha-L-fucosidase
MRKIAICFLVSACIHSSLAAQTAAPDPAHAQTPATSQTQKARDERMQWWREARFGMFIHWGVYAQLAGVYQGHEQEHGGAEWIMNMMKIPVADYQSYAKQFNPVKFNADQWVLTAKNAGMKYIVITAKHHDGFALFQSAASKWNIADATPYGKDILKPLAAACKKYGIKLGFYYSQAQDWNNPGGAVSRKLAREGWPNPDSAKINAFTEEHHGHWDPAQETASFDQYIDRVAVPQVRELMTHYGDVAVLWWDTPTNMTDEAASKLQELLKLQPAIITNDRLKRPNFPGDTKTPEQKIPKLSDLDGKDWETCMTMNGTWGYRTSDNKWKSTETLIHNLVDIASKGGNYLLNVGPKPDGTFPEQSIQTLKEIGEWMKINSESIYATQASPLAPLAWGRCTKKETEGGTILYLSVFDWPADGKLVVPGVKNPVASAKGLAGGKELKTETTADGLVIDVPASPENKIEPVIKLVLKGKLGS